MEVGVLLGDPRSDNREQEHWLEGVPDRSFWSGIKVEGRRLLPVTAYRCPACGWLDSYAPDVPGVREVREDREDREIRNPLDY